MESEALLSTCIRSTFIGFKRRQRKLHPRFALLKIDNVEDKTQASNYINNAVYLAWRNKEGDLVENRGFIKKVHGNKGVVMATFQRNLNPRAVGQLVYVKLYKVQ